MGKPLGIDLTQSEPAPHTAQPIVNPHRLPSSQPADFSCEVLIRLFNELFVPSMQTCLCGGSDEPIYMPASADQDMNKIYFTQDYCASALHEIAHWCVAGFNRLGLIDFGYWYAPDGRTAEQQSEFERVEIKPQALEWIFSVACGLRFRVSADNLAQGLGPSTRFKQAVAEQARIYCQVGLPGRAATWAMALANYFEVADPFNPSLYHCEFLG
jgi:elongation factor P hydroxylase